MRRLDLLGGILRDERNSLKTIYRVRLGLTTLPREYFECRFGYNKKWYEPLLSQLDEKKGGEESGESFSFIVYY